MNVHYDEQQLDALRELASIGSGTAATTSGSSSSKDPWQRRQLLFVVRN